MNFNPSSRIRVECNNWYELDDRMIKVCLRNGNTVILNPDYRDLWLAIGYGTVLSDLRNAVKDRIDDDTFDALLNTLLRIDLINIIEPQDEFNSIFN